MSKLQISKISPFRVIVLAGALLLLMSVLVWWRFVFTSPGNVFDRMIANRLATVAVSKEVIQSEGSQKVTEKSTLIIQPVAQVHVNNVLQQDIDTAVTTESIGTPEADFVRYTDIKIGQNNEQTKTFDFSNVLGVWGKTDQSSAQGGGSRLFNQNLIGVVPLGNLPQSSRKELTNMIKTTGVYEKDLSRVKKLTVNGRPVYSYDVTVRPVAYISMLKALGVELGLKQLEQVNPADYADSEALLLALDVDVLSGQLTKISYLGAERSESYSAYGSRVPVALPATSIPMSELQNRLQKTN